MKGAESYVDQIMQDDVGNIVSETPTIFEDEHIERIYVFQDAAVVKYEWFSVNRSRFNHRFTLIETPAKNPHGLKKGIIKTINY